LRQHTQITSLCCFSLTFGNVWWDDVSRTIKRNRLAIDNECINDRYKNVILPIPIIDDGHHRFAAIVYLGLPKFKATYCGRIDVLRYLEGKRKTKPVF